LPRGAGEAVGAPERARAGAGAEVEAIVADGAGQLAAEERAVATDPIAGRVRIGGHDRDAVEVAERGRDGTEHRRRTALALHALLVAPGQHAGEGREATRRRVLGDRAERHI